MKKNISISDLLDLSSKIYGVSDDRLYDMNELFYYHQKWLLRYIDDKKRGISDDAIKKFLISVAWFFAIINRFQIDLSVTLKKRYSWKCPFCLEIPCFCQSETRTKSKKTGRPTSTVPEYLFSWQKMIEKIYPQKSSEFKNLAILQSQDNFHQSFRKFRHDSSHRSLKQIEIASVDYFVEILKVANNLNIDLAKKYFELLSSGCFVCKKTPCQCFYSE